MAVYEITIEVTDEEVTPKTLSWLLSEAGEVLTITQWNTNEKENN